ncbi:hypothetical protein ACJIZ3_012795 [Penstemon smallii]|uniref:Bifunctional inhibitor/plant lipid transfer protein/seed storage helical domain-containing protein n=1 Tax=Penstemon smallii TaxID=265156 RepID=A0ABD3UQY9_9LAMI
MSRNNAVRRMWSSGWIMGLVVLVLALEARRGMSEISCTQAVMPILSCKDFLVGDADSVPVACCQGAEMLNNLAKNKDDLKTLCLCLKQAATALKVKADRAAQLPQICKIATSIAINPDVDCNSIGSMYDGNQEHN